MTYSVPLKYCEYSKESKQLRLASEFFGMPNKFTVVSHHTNKEIEFRPIHQDHPMFDQDGWDGEISIYEPVVKIPNVETLVIYHQY
jgi:hypothetical protein